MPDPLRFLVVAARPSSDLLQGARVKSMVPAALSTAGRSPLQRAATPLRSVLRAERPRYASTSAANTGNPSPQPRFEPPPAPATRSNPSVGSTFAVLTLTGLAVTGYGIWSYYSSFETWPAELRPDLRAAVKAERAGEGKLAEKKYRQALETAKQLTDEQLGGDALIKRTGIAIALAGLLEKGRQYDAAYRVYLEAWSSCLTSASASGQSDSVEGRSGVERARAAALSQKLGEVAERIAEVGPSLSTGGDDDATPAQRAIQALRSRERRNQPGQSLGGTTAENSELPPPPPPPLPTRRAAREAAERHLVWSVEELLRLSVAERRGLSAVQSDGTPAAVALADLDLPPWVSRTDLLGSIEALGSLYAARGRAEYAVPLYLQALQLLVPMTPEGKPKPRADGAPVTVADRCRAAIVLNNLSHVLLESAQDAAAAATTHSVTESRSSQESKRSIWNLSRRKEQGESPESTDAGDVSSLAQGRSNAAVHYAKRGLQLVQDTNDKAGWGLQQSLATPDAAQATSTKQLELVTEDEGRTAAVKRECLQCEVALLLNLGSLAVASGDKCDARNYLQKAWRLAEREGFREARNRAGSMLAGLERFQQTK
ncbi:unnamed protein product [Parajaminaea phylloscopi]